MIEVIGHGAGAAVGDVEYAAGGAPHGGQAGAGEVIDMDAVAPGGCGFVQYRQAALQARQRQSVGAVNAGNAQDAERETVARRPIAGGAFGVQAAARAVGLGIGRSNFINPNTLTITINATDADQYQAARVSAIPTNYTQVA